VGDAAGFTVAAFPQVTALLEGTGLPADTVPDRIAREARAPPSAALPPTRADGCTRADALLGVEVRARPPPARCGCAPTPTSTRTSGSRSSGRCGWARAHSHCAPPVEIAVGGAAAAVESRRGARV
jgi:hypothetical protein